MLNNLEFNIFDNNKESYIIGDLLNMPYFFANYNNNPHCNIIMYNLFKKTAAQYPNNILGIYDKLRTDENESIPNVNKIIDSIDNYTKHNVDVDKNLKNLLNMCKDKTNLFVHLRSGDKGIADNEFINKINEISINYKKIIILTGIHQNSDRSCYFPSIDESIKNTKISLQNLKIDESKLIIDLSEPDIHLCVMRNANNLMLHIGGFSILGALSFKGENLYLTKLFFPIANNDNKVFKYINNYKIL